MEDAELAKLAAECERAQMRARPHLLYGARVWKTNLTEEGKEWACGLVYDSAPYPPYCGTVQVEVWTTWGTAYPVAFGSSPEAACLAFDDLWSTGKTDG